MSRPLHLTTAAIIWLLSAATLWLPSVEAGRDAAASVQGPVTATYSLPLAA
jgi:hypothetical protein